MQQDHFSSAHIDCTEIALRLRAGDPDARSDLYHLLRQRLHLQLRRAPPENREDILHNVFLETVRAIDDGTLRDPAAALAFAWTVCRRRIADMYGERCALALDTPLAQAAPDRRPSPEEIAAEREQIQLLARAIQRLPGTDREILRRFYLLGQSPQEICADMKLTETQYRNRKSRAKERVLAFLQRYSRSRQAGADGLRAK